MTRLALLLALTLLPACPIQPTASAEETSPLTGFYGGVSAGVVNVIAGADVGGTDVLMQDARTSVEVFGGARMRIAGGLVIGAEAAWGHEDADLSLSQAGLKIDYSNSSHVRYGGLAGLRTGERGFLFAYVHETKRDFDVTGTTTSGTFTQTDEQGLLGYGLGYEHRFTDHFGLRATVGQSRGDFDDNRNMDPEKPLEVSIGAVYAF